MSDVLTTLDKAGKRWGDDTEKGRHYRINDVDYISVTTALEHGLGKPNLIRASAKYTAEYVADNFLDVRQYGIDNGDTEFKRWLKTRYREEWDRRMNLGSDVHDAIEFEILNDAVGKAVYSDKQIAARMRQFHHFAEDSTIDFEAAEVVVVNETLGYAGTLDAIGTFDLGPPSQGFYTAKELAEFSFPRAMIDFKTGSEVWPESAIQLAAYAHAEYMLVGDQQLEIPKVDYCAVLHLKPRSWKLIPVDVEAAWPYVQPVVEAARFHTESPEVLYEPLLQGAWKA
jgi:hypothetical protein